MSSPADDKFYTSGDNQNVIAELSPQEWELIKLQRASVTERYAHPIEDRDIIHEDIVPPETVSTRITYGDYVFEVKAKQEDMDVTRKTYKNNPKKVIIGEVGNSQYVRYVGNDKLIYEFLNGQMNVLDKFDARKLMSMAMKLAHHFKLMK